MQENIYKDTNGFPLNISNISINYFTRTVTLSLTNYGKSYYEKSKNYLFKYTPPRIIKYSGIPVKRTVLQTCKGGWGVLKEVDYYPC